MTDFFPKTGVQDKTAGSVPRVIKFRACFGVSNGFYLDMFVNPKNRPDGTPHPYYRGPKGGSRLNAFIDRLDDAINNADDCIWIFGERGRLIRGLTKDPKRGPDVIRRLKAKDCSVWTYECSYYMQTQPVLSYYRLYPMEAYTMGLDGAAVWTSGSRSGDDGWDSSDGYDDGVCWVGNDRKYVTTKRFEAFREGLEDVAYLDLLKKIDTPEAKALVVEMGKMVKGLGLSQAAMDAWRNEVGRLLDRMAR